MADLPETPSQCDPDFATVVQNWNCSTQDKTWTQVAEKLGIPAAKFPGDQIPAEMCANIKARLQCDQKE